MYNTTIKAIYSPVLTLSAIERIQKELNPEMDSPNQYILLFMKTKLDSTKQTSQNYISLLTDILKDTDIQIKVKLKDTIVTISKLNYNIPREEKIYLNKIKNKLINKVVDECDILTLIIIELIETINIKQIEETIKKDKLPEDKDINTDKKLTITKIQNVNTPLTIGRVSRKEQESILYTKPGYTMTIEEYGDKIKKLMDQTNQTQITQSTTDTTEDSPEENSSQEEYLRIVKEKEEYISPGDGNRLGTK
ncbi:hypothetical protein NEOKW01_1672 [Nematocida sp. AWRm80]|nr:hypothetical protein NEOKW01_1672 [Nematocida sp. AWRm80]